VKLDQFTIVGVIAKCNRHRNGEIYLHVGKILPLEPSM
jgi:hypothetical protein